jgi:hypothetical protein
MSDIIDNFFQKINGSYFAFTGLFAILLPLGNFTDFYTMILSYI